MEHNKLDTTKVVKYLKQVEEAKNEAIKATYDLAEQAVGRIPYVRRRARRPARRREIGRASCRERV